MNISSIFMSKTDKDTLDGSDYTIKLLIKVPKKGAKAMLGGITFCYSSTTEGSPVANSHLCMLLGTFIVP